MDSVREALTPGWVGSLIGLLSLAIALLIYKASLVGARPVYQRRALRLVGPDAKALHASVEIRFDGQPVDRLTKTHVVLWNSGRALLRGADVVDTDPVRCEFSEGARVLEARVVRMTRDTNKFAAHLDGATPNRALLSFDYLDPGDGAVVEILHTDLKGYPDVKGTIRGVPNGILDWGRILSTRGSLRFPFASVRLRVVLTVAICLGISFAAVGLLLPTHVVERLSKGDPSFRWGAVTLGTLYTALPLLMLWLTRRRFPRKLSLPELEE